MESDQISFDTRDEYQRRPIAENVIRLISSGTQVSPMVIDGGWGTGKTEFCKKLIHLIENGNSGFKAVYVDAFRADHADEPLMTLLAAVLKLLPEGDRPALIQKALPAIRFGIKTSLKAGVSWLLKQDAADMADDFEDDLKKAGDQAINHAVESLLTDHIAAEESIKTLKNALLEIAKESPIVIFVDELDRCRPDYAVSMMESIKHIFDVENVQFVLITNSDQLRASINHCYGEAIEAQRYLDKFIGFSFALPDKCGLDRYNSNLTSVIHMRSGLNNSEILKGSSLDKEGPLNFFNLLIKENNLSLREVETFVRYLEIYQVLTEGGGFPENLIVGYALLRLFGVFLFCFEPTLSKELVRGIIDAQAIANLVGKSRLFDVMGQSHPDHGDFVTAIVGFESTSGKGNFTPENDEAAQAWEEYIRRYFAHGGFPPEIGERTKIITDVIETLKLGNLGG